MRLLALLVVALFTTTITYQQATTKAVLPNGQRVAVSTAAAQFLSYRAAVMMFMAQNPSFTGAISATQLSGYAAQFSSVFVSNYAAGNAVTVSGTGRLITTYAKLPTGALQTLLAKSGNDASIGLSSGSTWTTAATGVTATPQPLNVTVAAGDVVSVVTTGN